MTSGPIAGPVPADRALVVGVDFGTLSGRAVVVRVSDGKTLGTAVTAYRHGVMEERLAATGEPLPPDWALQVPSDYVDVLREAVPAAIAAAGVDPADVIAIATDFTACTLLPVTEDGTPLCELPELGTRPHAYVKLWKHHAAQGQADRINGLAAERDEPWLKRYGGRLSSEWTLAKSLQLLEEDPDLYSQTAHVVEAADWIVWQLCGNLVRNACTAGYKAAYQEGSYPDRDFFAALDPGFGAFAEEKLRGPVVAVGRPAGALTAEAARWTGLLEGTVVAVGNVDAHVTAPAAQATRPGQLLAIMGTSTCHVMSSDALHLVSGMCGVVEGGVIPGLWGYEAGQSAVGDIFGWFVDNAVPASYAQAAAAAGLGIHEHLTRLAGAQEPGQHGLMALDWHGGNRSVLVDHELSGLVLGLTLRTRPEDVYRALIEATAFGTRTIVEAFESAGLPITEVVVAGGLLRNPTLMQIYADVLRRPLSVLADEQGPALGSAIYAAVAAGAHADVHAAAAAMGRRDQAVYVPDDRACNVYESLFAEYTLLHDHFGRGGNDVMHRLRALRRRTLELRQPEGAA